MNLLTPDVYIKEEATLPPSVAEVSTAVPIFIGHTELTVKGEGVPVRINSLPEYRLYFGGPAPRNYTVTVENNALPYALRVETDADAIPETHKLFYALDHFFKNGGSDCYVLSVGTYQEAKTKERFSAALDIVAMEDEPTLIVLSEASSLPEADYYELCSAALAQCNQLMDRFCLIDVIRIDKDAADFKTGIGNNNLKYGAAYYPFLKTSIGFQYEDAGVTVINRGTASAPKATTTGSAGTSSTTNAGAPARVAAAPTFAVDTNSLTISIESDTQTQTVVDEWNKRTDLEKKGFDLDSELGNTELLGAIENETIAKGRSKTVAGGLKVTNNGAAAKLVVVVTPPAATAPPVAPASGTTPGASSSNSTTTLDEIKNTQTALYNAIKQRLSLETVTLPPSPAVAGVYATVDRERGVWKAPANVSLSAVVAPAQKIDAGQQGRLNIDADSGKSINAIRSFTGKGTLIWGARTLAGNDNEWRYISVRRLFSMVEESAKKATFFAVFEPNDAATWLKVRGMIESYLYTLWQQGALAGPSPKAAYYVRVGLGTTMTTDDVNNGRMIIEIGLAAVRPAEFIVLTFSHKLQEA
ncbi:phage tail sheath family protein [Hymenobacter convexus]|uniref:phage tail sheath family protein n=1 Tax=Hymenobacter sp. CA1UV-4 TaxID=3063782 RepID=UPI002712C6D1|nr:phage tail sheath C-terminal domain-containing protein [Hymenobacter sp. CA1UV-4]MDO7854094.1 phage tail sheath C-terminal domain-containing protein [Hymenobacter sp. CA1UV-4]